MFAWLGLQVWGGEVWTYGIGLVGSDRLAAAARSSRPHLPGQALAVQIASLGVRDHHDITR